MKVETWLSSLAVLSVALILSGCVRSPKTVDEVIDRNTRAMGGRQAIEAVHSVAIDLHIVDPDFAVDGSYRATRAGQDADRCEGRGKARFHGSLRRSPRLAVERGGHGDDRWVGEGDSGPAPWRRTAGTPVWPARAAAARPSIDLIGREKIENINCYALQLTLDDGYTTTLYVDPKSWLITHRRDVRPLHVDIDPTPTTIEQRMSDFRQVAGVWFPFANTETDLKTGKVLETTTIRTITVNPKIDEAIFEKL